MSTNLSEEDKKEVFGSFDPDKYSEETKEKYGQTNAYKQSQQKTKNYTKEDWANMALESDFIVQNKAGFSANDGIEEMAFNICNSKKNNSFPGKIMEISTYDFRNLTSQFVRITE